MSIDVDVRGNTNPLIRDVEAATKRINRNGGIKIRIDEKGVTQPLGNMRRSADEFTKSLEASNARVLAFGASVGIINAVSEAFKGLVQQTIVVEKNLTDINVVMGLTTKQLDKFGSGLFKVAAETGAGFRAASEAATEFARQGLSVAETLQRTKDALILTRLTGMKAAESVKSLTAAMNTFKGEIKDSTTLVSKFAAVDVKFAVSAQDFADAIARSGQAARDAGVDINELIGLVTAAQERTARGGAVIGNSFKTIFTRVQRSSTLKELENLGIAVRDLQGKTLPAMQVLQGLAERYDSLTDAQRSYISQNVAGVFQINILKAAMADLGKENSVTAQATQIAANATDESNRKNEQLRQTMSALASETGTAVQLLAKSIGDIALAPGINKVLDGVKGLAESATSLLGDGENEGNKFAKGLLAGIGNFLSGPGLVVLTAVVAKLFTNAMKYGVQSLQSLLSMNKAATQRKGIEQSLLMVLAQNTALQEEMLRNDISRADKEKIILNIIKQQTIEAQKLATISKSMAGGLMGAGVNQNLSYGRRGRRANGFVPNFAEDDEERKQAQAGGYAPGSVRAMNIPGHGGVIYNTAEKVKKFDGMSQPAIMPPAHSRAGKKYKDDFASAHGFDPYASHGFIPNFSVAAIKKFYDSGQKLSKFGGNMTQAHRDLLADWRGGQMTGRSQSGVVYPSAADIEKYLNQQGTSSKALKAASAPTVAKMQERNRNKAEKDKKDFESKVAKSINLNEPKYGITNVDSLGVMMGSGPQSTIDKTYFQALKKLAPDNQKFLIKKQALSEGKKLTDAEAAKKASKSADAQVSVRLKSRGLYPVDDGDVDDAGRAIGQSKLTSIFKDSLGEGMNKASGKIHRTMFPQSKASVTNAVDHVTGNGSLMGGLLEAGLSAALGEKPSENPGRAFDYVGSSAKTLSNWMVGSDKLKKVELKISEGAAETGKVPNKTVNQYLNKAAGFIPNFADPLSDAIGREQEAGVPVSKIRVGTHKSLVAKSNPMGIGVTNTDDEPRGLKDVFGARGFVPNYVNESLAQRAGGAMGSVAGIERMNEAAEAAAEEIRQLEPEIEDLKSNLDSASQSYEDNEKENKDLKKTKRDLRKQIKEQDDIVKDSNQKGKKRSRAYTRRQKLEQDLIKLDQDIKTSNSKTLQSKRAAQKVSQDLQASERKLTQASNQQANARKMAARRERMQGNRGMAGMAATMGASMLAGQLQQSSNPNAQLAGGAINSAATGAMIGQMFGPWGIAIGAGAGAIYGFIDASNQAREKLVELANATLEATRAEEMSQGQQIFSGLSKSQSFNQVMQDDFNLKDGINLNKIAYNPTRAYENRGFVASASYLKSTGQQRALEGRRQVQENANDIFADTNTYTGETLGKRFSANPIGTFLDTAGAGGKQKRRDFEKLFIEDFLKKIGADAQSLGLEKDSIMEDNPMQAATTFLNPLTPMYSGSEPTLEFNNEKHQREMPILAVAQAATTGVMNKDGKLERQYITSQGMKFEDEIAEKNFEKAKEITDKFVGTFQDHLTSAEKFANAGNDFEMLSVSLKELSSASKMKAEELMQGASMEEIFKGIRENIAESAGDPAKLQELKDVQLALAKEAVNQLPNNFQEEMTIDGEIQLVKKATLQALLDNEQGSVHAANIASQLVGIHLGQKATLEKQKEVMDQQLSAAEASAVLQQTQIDQQQEINKAMSSVAAAYKQMSSRLGKLIGPGMKMDLEYQAGLSKAGGTRDLKKQSLTNKAREKIVSDFMTNEQSVQYLATLKQNKEFENMSNSDIARNLMNRDIEDLIGEGGLLNEEGLSDITRDKDGKITGTGPVARSRALIKAQLDNQLAQEDKNFELAKLNLGYNLENSRLIENRNRRMKSMEMIEKEIMDKLNHELVLRQNQQQLIEEQIKTARGSRPVTMDVALRRSLFDLDREGFNKEASILGDSNNRARGLVSGFGKGNDIDFDAASIQSMIDNNENPEEQLEILKARINAVVKEEEKRREIIKKFEDQNSLQSQGFKEMQNALSRELGATESKLQTERSITAERKKQAEIIHEELTGAGAFQKGMEQYGVEAYNRVKTFKHELGKMAPEAFSRNMSAAMMKVVREGGSVKDAMLEGLIGALDSINQRMMDNLFDSAFSLLAPHDDPAKLEVANLQSQLDTLPSPLSNFETAVQGAADKINSAMQKITVIDPLKNAKGIEGDVDALREGKISNQVEGDPFQIKAMKSARLNEAGVDFKIQEAINNRIPGIQSDQHIQDFQNQPSNQQNFQNFFTPLSQSATTLNTTLTTLSNQMTTANTSLTPIPTSLSSLATAADKAALALNSVQAPAPAPAYTGGIMRRYGGGDVPAKISDGEFVMGRDAVKRMGVSNMSILNSGALPSSITGKPAAFNRGGTISALQKAPGSKVEGSYIADSQSSRNSGGGGGGGGFMKNFGSNLAVGAGTMAAQYLLGKLMDDDEKKPHVSRPDDYFQKNRLYRSRNMSTYFMQNDRRVKEDIDKGRAKEQEELQDWIEMQNKRQALGRQVVTMIGNAAVSAASAGMTGADGSFMGFSNKPGEIRAYDGGAISGTPGIDRIPAMLSEGEYVINARSARKIGIPTLEKINAGKYNEGGLVGDTTNKDLGSASGSATNNINITVNVSSDNSTKENSTGQAGQGETQEKKKGAEDLSKRIKQEVITIIKEENRPGGLLR